MFIVCGFPRYALREDSVENEQLCHCCCIGKDTQTIMLGCETPTSARSTDCGTQLTWTVLERRTYFVQIE
jgi:hypothetical protein